MGTVFSIIRRTEQDTSSQLADIDTKLKAIRDQRESVLRRKEALYTKTRKYGLGMFSILLMGLYLTVPDDSIERFIQIVFVFVIYPVTVLLLRKLWKHYYDRRLAKADGEIKPLEKKKEGLLKSVMEKEPYNKAREILKRYGSNDLTQSFDSNQFEVPKPPGSAPNQRKKLVNGTPVDSFPKNQMNSTVAEPSPATRRKQPQAGDQLTKPNCDAQRQLNQIIGGMSPIMRTPKNSGMPNNTPQVRKTAKKTVRPLPSEKVNQTLLDKMVDYLVGSKPEQMYALICKNCKNHNGLAIKEEFEYLEWRCTFCHHLNMAPKQRPAPPQLMPQRPADAYNSTIISPPTNCITKQRKASAEMKGGDSGIESDQMEKKAPVSVKEDDNDALHHYDESLDESILAGHPAH